MNKNLIFLTMSREPANINNSGIYPDLLRKFRNEGFNVYIVMYTLQVESISPQCYNKTGKTRTKCNFVLKLRRRQDER